MILLQIVFLGVTLITIFNYIYNKVSARQHRLLPLVLGIFGGYNFYEIVLTLSQEPQIFARLEDMLMVQLVCLLTFYLYEVLGQKMYKPLQLVTFLLLLGVNISLFAFYREPERYIPLQRMFTAYNTGLVLLAGIQSVKRRNGIQRQLAQKIVLYIFLSAPIFVANLSWTSNGTDGLIISALGACLCLYINMGIWTNRFIDASSIIQENVFSTMEIATILLDEDFYFVEENEEAKKMFSFNLGNAYAAKVYDRVFHELYRELAQGPENRCEFEFEGKRILQMLSPITYEGKTIGYIVSVFDITEEYQTQKERDEALLLAEEKAEYKSRFLADMSHELRSPVHAIIGISDLLLEKQSLTPMNKSMVLYLKNAGNSLLERVNAILAYSKLEANKMELENLKYNWDEEIRGVIQETTINLQNSKVDFVVEMKTEYPQMVYGDRGKVRGILQNVLSNSVKYTKEGRITCQIFCESKGARWRISFVVKDTGIGMSEEQIKKATEEYAGFTGDSKIESTGLGLTIVKETAELMGGALKLESDGETGTTVTVVIYQEKVEETDILPARVLRKQEMIFHKVFEQEEPLAAFTFPEARVLLAEDIQVNRIIFKQMVDKWGFELDCVEDGDLAIEAASEKEYDMIFLDLMMPRMDGMTACSKLRQITEVPIIALTANLSEGIQTDCKNAGFTRFLEKPIQQNHLKKVIEEFLPLEKRKPVPAVEIITNEVWKRGKTQYVKNLGVFREELAQLRTQLEGYYATDLRLFQTKVHGIKGVSRQFGREVLAYFAEIVEMAAKLENRRFLDNSLSNFYAIMDETIGEIDAEIMSLENARQLELERRREFREQEEFEQEQAEEIQGQEEEKPQQGEEELLQQLYDAFAAYDMNAIRSILQELEERETSFPEIFFSEMQRFVREYEYEEGLEFLKIVGIGDKAYSQKET